MRFLCVSDQIDPLVYSASVAERYGDVDAVLCAGDLPMDYIDFIVTTLNKPTFFVFGNHNLTEFRFYTKKSLDAGSPPAQTNMYDMSHQHGGDYASNKVIRTKHLFFTDKAGKKTPLLITGVSGSIKYNNGQDQYTDTEMFWQLLSLAPSLLFNKLKYGRYCDVFLTHASPRHIHDKEDPCHRGFECFNWFIKKFQPTLMVHGHIHLYDLQAQRTSVCEKTTIVNAYSHVLIDLIPADKTTGEQGDNSGFTVSVITDR
jgi:hypothetical protein